MMFESRIILRENETFLDPKLKLAICDKKNCNDWWLTLELACFAKAR
jgi:hypothetical protein